MTAMTCADSAVSGPTMRSTTRYAGLVSLPIAEPGARISPERAPSPLTIIGVNDEPPSLNAIHRTAVLSAEAAGSDLMTWTKLGDEWPEIGRDLTGEAYRTHIDALCWSNRFQLDLLIPKRDLRRFGDAPDPDAAVAELIDRGVWQDVGDSWWIGVRFPEWQLEAAVVKHRREQNALRQRRHRMHSADDHSLCDPKRCAELKSVTRYVTRDETRDPGRGGTDRDGSGSTDQPETNGLGQCRTCDHREPLGPDGRCENCTDWEVDT